MSNLDLSQSDLLTYCAELNSNDDLLGLGVRIAFYLQIYLSGVLALLPHADFSASAWGVSATFWALFVAALVSWLQDTLTLFQAVIGVYLLFLHALASTLCIAPSYGNLRGLRPPTLPFVVVSVVLSNVAVAIMGILVGLRGRRIGPSRECNEVMKLQILFLRFTPAEKDGRSFILAFSIAYLVIFMAFTIFQLAIWTHRKGWKDGEMTPDCLVITLDHFKENVRRPGDILYLRTNMFLRHRLWLATLTMETVWMCSMFNIEYTLYLNGIQGTSTTGFGQILAIFTLAVPLEAIVRWTAEWNRKMKTKPHMSLRKDRVFRAFTSVIGNVGEGIFAPFILFYLSSDYLYRFMLHKIKGTAHPHALSQWKRKGGRELTTVQSDAK